MREHPRAISNATLQTADGGHLALADLRGRWLLVDFIYTRCETYCTVQGSAFAQLQDRLAQPIADHRVMLLSISFDPQHDDPAQLAAYQQRSRARAAGWIAARPSTATDLAALMQAFGVTAVPDGIGGFVHNAAIAIVDPQGRLVRIFDWNAPDEAERFVRQGLAP